MENCIFCKFVKGEIEPIKVYEDDNFLAFLDIRPLNKGHTLIIPKKHYRWMWDIEENYSNIVNKIANALKKAFNTNFIVSFVIGEEVPHAHFHLVPRFKGDGHGSFIDRKKSFECTNEELKEIAKLIISEIS